MPRVRRSWQQRQAPKRRPPPAYCTVSLQTSASTRKILPEPGVWPPVARLMPHELQQSAHQPHRLSSPDKGSSQHEGRLLWLGRTAPQTSPGSDAASPLCATVRSAVARRQLPTRQGPKPFAHSVWKQPSESAFQTPERPAYRCWRGQLLPAPSIGSTLAAVQATRLTDGHAHAEHRVQYL